MENYQLKNSEVVLFRNEIRLSQDEKKSKNKIKTELLLTNENLVFINKTRKLFQKEIADTVVVSIDSIKIYREMPYMLKKGTLVEIYTINGEYFLEFETKKQAKEFYDKTMRVTSGYSKFVRGIKRASKEIKETNEALDIDIVGATKKTLNFAADVAIEYVDSPKKGKVQLIGAVAKVFKRGKAQEAVEVKNEKTQEQLVGGVEVATEENSIN